MKIAAYDVTSTSSRVFTSASHITTTAKISSSVEPLEIEQPLKEDNATISDQARQALDQALEQAKQNKEQLSSRLSSINAARKYDGWGTPSNPQELKLNILLQLIEQLTGKKFKYQPPELNMQQPERPALTLQGGTPMQMTKRIDFEQTSMYHEFESVSYNANGVVQTADGQTIAFDVSLNMSREFAQYSSVNFSMEQSMNFCDPLVINYAGGAASLTENKYSFDLLADGVQRDISFAAQGSGFLALDKNGDGEINDGSELFGPQSGDGFSELRKYDGDGNGWIDENDAVYSKLSVWTKDEQGNDLLISLKDADVGAIYLGDLQTQYTLGNSTAADGMIRSTSFFLKDSGGAGTVQHVDLVI